MNLVLPFSVIYPIIFAAKKETTRVFLVGGSVRDLLLGEAPQDLDLIVTGEVKKISREIANAFHGAIYSLDDERETMRVMVEDNVRSWKLDIALMRGGDLEEDLRTRDFTVNAMALEIHADGAGTLIDILFGQRDLLEKVLRPCSSTSILDDPIRTLRGIRLAISLGFVLSNEARQQIQKSAGLLSSVSGERKRDELFKLLALDQSSTALPQLLEFGLFGALFPAGFLKNIALPGLLLDTIGRLTQNGMNFARELIDYLDQTLVEERSVSSLLQISALAFLNAESLIEFCEAYVLSNREKDFLLRVHQGIMLCNHFLSEKVIPDPRALYRYYQSTQMAGVGACLVACSACCEAEVKGGLEPLLFSLFDAYFHHPERYVSVTPLLDGNDLIRIFYLNPGPLFKDILAQLCEAQAVGEVKTRVEAEHFIQQLLP